MTLMTARQVMPVTYRTNWKKPRLDYLPRALYFFRRDR